VDVFPVTETNEATPAQSLWNDFKDIWSKATLISACVTIPTLGVAGMANHVVDPVRPLYDALVLSWPLVISATILVMLFLRGSFSRMEGLGIFWALMAIVIGPYLIAFLLGVTGFTDPRLIKDHWSGWIELLSPGKAVMIVYNIREFYFSAYGLWRVVVALACGSFLAWVFQYKILPYVARL
jgi:hypothetical protein